MLKAETAARLRRAAIENLGKSEAERRDPGLISVGSGELTNRLRRHPNAERATRRSLTYNGMLQPILTERQHALEQVRRYVSE